MSCLVIGLSCGCLAFCDCLVLSHLAFMLCEASFSYLVLCLLLYCVGASLSCLCIILCCVCCLVLLCLVSSRLSCVELFSLGLLCLDLCVTLSCPFWSCLLIVLSRLLLSVLSFFTSPHRTSSLLLHDLLSHFFSLSARIPNPTYIIHVGKSEQTLYCLA
jgi:hypothetical protein